MRISLCLLGWAIVTVPLSLWPGGSVDTLTDLFLKSLILFWLIANTVITVSRFRQFAWGLTLMTVPISSSALVDYLSGTYLLGTQRIVGYAAGLTSNPNDLALTLNLIIPFILALLWLTRGPLRRAILLTVLGLDIAGVILSFSRGGFITLVVILAITSARLLRSRRRAWGVALLAILSLCLPLLPGSYWHRIATITDIESDETGSAQARRENTLGAVRFVLTHPIVGAGIGSNMLALNEEIGSDVARRAQCLSPVRGGPWTPRARPLSRPLLDLLRGRLGCSIRRASAAVARGTLLSSHKPPGSVSSPSGSPGSSIRWPTISTSTIWRVSLRRADWPGSASYLRRVDHGSLPMTQGRVHLHLSGCFSY